MIKILSEEEKKRYHHRYRNDDVFRQWSAILCQLEREAKEMDSITLWFLAQKCLGRLREIKQYRDEEIPYIYNDLIKECGIVQKGKERINRTPIQAERSAITVMCIMLTLLMNAVEKGHENEDFDNKAMCVAIDRLLQKSNYYALLMKAFFDRKTGNDGKKVVIAPSDPMKDAFILNNMDDTAKQEVESMKSKVLAITSGLKVLFKKDWNLWEAVWSDICLDEDLSQLLSQIDPRKNNWGMNEKMICNVIGMFLEIFEYKKLVSTANSALSPSKNRRDYISSHGRNGGSSAVFSEEQHNKVENIIKSKKLNNQ